MPLTSGRKLAAYEIISALGAGGMGEVYRALDSRLGREVALKVLPPEVINEPGRLERFDREARAIAALNHPNIVTIYSTEEADGVRFLTMELVDGCTLGDLIVPTGMAIAKFLDIAMPLADALAAAHQKNITHRDLKPGNVMMSNDGRVKVLDFGLARVGGVDASEQTLIATQAPISHQGMVLGTMPYMSPEQVEGRTVDPRSDLFSLGVIFYELLSGNRPFTGSSSPALMSAILRDTPSSVCDKRTDVPDPLERLISRLLEKRPEDRVQTARDVFNELRHIKGGVGSTGVQRQVSDRSAADGLSVAVLPFTVRGADADADAMASALTDDIAASLARFAGLTVVASQSTRAFKDSPLDVRDIAARLRARYVVSGNVRKSGAAIRTTAQLIDADSGAQLWSETYDRRLEGGVDLFAIQDDVVDHIVATLADQGGVLAQSMMRSVQRTSISESTAAQLIVRMWAFQHEASPQRHAELRDRIERELESAPDSAELWALLANLYICEHSLIYNARPDPLGRALRAARRAIELDRANQAGWLWLGLVHFHLHDRAGLEEAFSRATQINPRNAHVMAWAGNILTHVGEYERGTQLTARAMQINPAHPGWVHFSVFNRSFAEGNFEAALQAARRVNVPTFFWMHFAIAAAAGHLGRQDEGHSAAEAMVRMQPALADEGSLREFIARWYWPEEMIESLLDGVRLSRDATAEQQEARPKSGPGAKPPSSSVRTPSGGLSIAVLPFTDLSEKKDQDWFCDGIAEEILNALAPLPGLRVAARASAFSLRGKADDLRSIAEKLNVTTVLEGSVRRAGDRVRITAQLSDAHQGRQLWSQRFDREMKDIFDVQDEIARAIVERLRLTLGAGSPERLVEKATTNIEAYELLLRGRMLITRRGRAVLDAIPYFERAIALDANLAEAHALLGDAYRLLGLYGIARAREVMPKAFACAERALALDPMQQEALATLAIIATVYEWNLDETRRRSDRALAADPSHPRTLTERAVSFGFLGQPDENWQPEAIELIERALAIDPLNAWVKAMQGAMRMLTGRVAESVAITRQAIDLDADNFTAHWLHVAMLSEAGRHDEALQAAERALAMSGRHTNILTNVAAIYSERGELEKVEAIRTELRERAERSYIGYGAQAAVAAAAGRMDEARDLVAKGIAERDPYFAFWKLYAWRPVWKDEQCAAMIRATPLFQGTQKRHHNPR